MFDDLDNTLQQLLRRYLPPALVAQVSFSFVAPDAQFPPTSVALPAIDLFLYDVRENRDLRTNEWRIERQSDGTTLKTRAPVRLDCSYLITAWANQSSNTPAQDEHHLLGEVTRVLLRYPTLPADVLQGSLQGQEPLLPTTSLQSGRLSSLSDLWQAFGGRPRLALNYLVTLSVPPEAPVVGGPVVTEREFNIQLKPD